MERGCERAISVLGKEQLVGMRVGAHRRVRLVSCHTNVECTILKYYDLQHRTTLHYEPGNFASSSMVNEHVVIC